MPWNAPWSPSTLPDPRGQFAWRERRVAAMSRAAVPRPCRGRASAVGSSSSSRLSLRRASARTSRGTSRRLSTRSAESRCGTRSTRTASLRLCGGRSARARRSAPRPPVPGPSGAGTGLRAGVIDGLFFSHLHSDEFRLIPGVTAAAAPIIHIISSVTPIYGGNPTVYEMRHAAAAPAEADRSRGVSFRPVRLTQHAALLGDASFTKAITTPAAFRAAGISNGDYAAVIDSLTSGSADGDLARKRLLQRPHPPHPLLSPPPFPRRCTARCTKSTTRGMAAQRAAAAQPTGSRLARLARMAAASRTLAFTGPQRAAVPRGSAAWTRRRSAARRAATTDTAAKASAASARPGAARVNWSNSAPALPSSALAIYLPSSAPPGTALGALGPRSSPQLPISAEHRPGGHSYVYCTFCVWTHGTVSGYTQHGRKNWYTARKLRSVFSSVVVRRRPTRVLPTAAVP